jgi:hypothetical protein
VNFAPAQTGNGVYFLQCCGNSANAYYKFSGTTIGSIFNVNQGQISFYLKSRQSFAQRLASGTSNRQVLDVRDANTTLFGFNTLAVSGYLLFATRSRAPRHTTFRRLEQRRRCSATASP